MWTPDYFVRYIELPLSVEGVTLPNSDGSFDIYINSRLSPERQEECLQHELRHISKDHFYNDTQSVVACESEAKGETPPPRLPNVFAEAPPNTIPIFNSLDVFKDYMFAMREQVQQEKTAGG